MKIFLAAGFVLLAASAGAQKTPVKKTVPVKKVTPAVKPLKNQVDSVSYAIGFMVANFYRNQQGIKNLNPAAVAKAVSDIYGGKQPLLNESQANMALMSYLNPALSNNLNEGTAFLEANKKRTGVKLTPSGLQYEVMVEGKGPKPTEADTVTVHYAGTLINGTEFDNSFKRGEPATFAVTGVIRGWTEALQLMPAGSKYKLFIPQDLAYGMNDNGPIPGGSVLVFEVELLSVNGKQ